MSKQKNVLRAALLMAALLGSMWLPDGAALLGQWIFGEGKDPVHVACAAFEQAAEQGGSICDGLWAFCDGISGYEAER